MAVDAAGKTDTTNVLTACDVFALACKLRDEIDAIEARQEQARDHVERLKVQQRELQSVLYTLELLEDEEKTATKTLHEEVEALRPSWTLAAMGSHGTIVGLEGGASIGQLPPQLASRTQMASTLRFLFKGSTSGHHKQAPEIAAPSGKKRPMADENVRPTKSTSSGKAKARTMKRILSEKIRRKANMQTKAAPSRMRKVSKSGDVSRLTRRKTATQRGSPASLDLISLDTSILPPKEFGFGIPHNT